MAPLRKLEAESAWRLHFGKRYLQVDDFIALCEAMGLYACTNGELEFYEHERLLLPTARLVMPDAYAIAFWTDQIEPTDHFELDDDLQDFHKLDRDIRYLNSTSHQVEASDLRHPIDRAWERIPHLERPAAQAFRPWDSYRIQVSLNKHSVWEPIAQHFYHYWQIHQVFYVRRFKRGMYWDGYPALNRIDDTTLWRSLDAVSYFQHMYQTRRAQALDTASHDEDGWKILAAEEEQRLREDARNYASSTLSAFSLAGPELFQALSGLLQMHSEYERIERLRLSEALKRDIGNVTELIHYSLGTPWHEIGSRAGTAGGFPVSYLDLLFPDRRQEVRARATHILKTTAKNFNQQAPGFAVSDTDIDGLLTFLETSDLTLFQFVLVELSRASFDLHAWYVAENFLLLKSIASFPESLVRAVLRNHLPSDMYRVMERLLKGRHVDIWNEYARINSYSSSTPASFAANADSLIAQIKNSTDERQYLGRSLALATLVRNFTHHQMNDDPGLLHGRCAPSVSAVLASTFLVWQSARSQGLLKRSPTPSP